MSVRLQTSSGCDAMSRSNPVASAARVLFIISGLVGIGLAGCGTSADGSSQATKHEAPAKVSAKYAGAYPIQVVCTTGMVADLARNVGGRHVQVVTLMGAGVDPHLYKASPADVTQLNRADIIFYSGLHLEGKLAELLERMAARKPTCAVAERIDESKILHDESGAHDPHVWFDVSLWSDAAGAVRDALADFDPQHADDYHAACDAYQSRLAELHTEAKEQLATVPRERRVLVTAHDAFQYFGRAYDLDVRGIQGISTDSEAGVKHVNDLVDFLVQRKIKAVFVETSVADQNVKALIEGCAAQNHIVTIGGELFSDAMGEEGTPEGTYEGMVRHNVKTIVGALK
jgi:manganese/zinc/iron transport system substrate-binding protein